MLMNLSAQGRRCASKAYLALTKSAGLDSCNSANQTPVVGPEIGSLPINALAIALALQAGILTQL